MLSLRDIVEVDDACLTCIRYDWETTRIQQGFESPVAQEHQQYPQGSKGPNNWVLGFTDSSYVGLYLGEYMIIGYLDP